MKSRTKKKAVNRIVTSLKRFSITRKLMPELFQTWYGLPVPPTHFYSPLPDLSRATNNLGRWLKEDDLVGLDLRLESQLSLLEALSQYRSECEALPEFSLIKKKGYGPGYGEVEAAFLHCMIRHLKPRKIIEVGSGVSTFYSLNALRMNREAHGHRAQMICIEPYPKPKLHELAKEEEVTLIVDEVQNVEDQVFKSLDANDLLFIDSSHVSKIDSDVNYLYLNVLPKLRKDVFIHIHDIPFPFLTLMPEHPLFTASALWNETAIVRAFLTFNRAFEVILCQSYLHLKHPYALSKVTSVYDRHRHFPDSLWIRKSAT